MYGLEPSVKESLDAVEDALMAAGVRPAPGGTLESSLSLLTALPVLQVGAPALSRDEVERLFARLAAAALGDPTARADLPPDAQGAATLLILRACMHHLGFDTLRVASRRGHGRPAVHSAARLP